MYRLNTLNKTIMFLTALFGIYTPYIVFGQEIVPPVPVADSVTRQSLTGISTTLTNNYEAFKAYVLDFDRKIYDNEDESLRALLSLNPIPKGAAELILPGREEFPNGGKTVADPSRITECDRRSITNPAKARKTVGGAWDQLITSGNILEFEGSYDEVQVNNSTSLSCLLQEIVEQNKLQINMQIHSLIKSQLNDALAVSLAQRTAGTISRANLEWVKRGNVMNVYGENGELISQESYPITGNPKDLEKAQLTARTRTIQQGVLADKESDKSFGICNPYKYTLARNLLRNAQKEDGDPLDTLVDEVGCQLTNTINPGSGLFASEDGVDEYLKKGTLGNKSALDTYEKMLLNDSNSPQGLEILMETRMLQQKGQLSSDLEKQYIAGGGYLPTIKCDPNDPYCDPRNSTIVTPGRLTADIIQKSANQQFDYLSGVKDATQLAGAQVDNFSSVNILTGGLQDFDTSRGLKPNHKIQQYITDMFNGIKDGYFDLQPGTIDWASGAMLQIYDSIMTDGPAYTGSESIGAPPRNTNAEK